MTKITFTELIARPAAGAVPQAVLTEDDVHKLTDRVSRSAAVLRACVCASDSIIDADLAFPNRGSGVPGSLEMVESILTDIANDLEKMAWEIGRSNLTIGGEGDK